MGDEKGQCTGHIKELEELDSGEEAPGGGGSDLHLKMLHQTKTLHLVEEVGMDKGKGWVQTVGRGPHIWSGANIWKTLGRGGCIWAEGYTAGGGF